MKLLSLLLWVGQFGLSVSFPTLFFLLLAVWIQNKFFPEIWIPVVLGSLGFLISLQTARSCLQSLRNVAEEAGGEQESPVSFNDHL